MTLNIENAYPPACVDVMRHAYLFVTEEWQHLDRQPIPDQGFEERFRESCVKKGWLVSQNRELNLGSGLDTASGVLHEIDLVIQNEPIRAIFELKNRAANPPGKNDVVVFFAKILDYLCLTPGLLKQTLVPIFLSTHGFDYTGLAASIGLGIHAIAPGLRPVPLLIDNARRMANERLKGIDLPQCEWDALDEFRVSLNRLRVEFAPADLNQRFDILNEVTLTVRAVRISPPFVIGDQLRSLSADCSRLIDVFKAADLRRRRN